MNNNDIYKGFTTDLQRRVGEHKSGKVLSTKNKNPRLICYEAYLLKSDAERRENFLKTTEGRRLLKMQLRDVINKFLMGSSGHAT